MDLILQLKKEHVEILHLLEGTAEAISDEDIEDSDLRDGLEELKEILVAHLELEDKLLYPNLANCGNKQAEEAGKKFSDEMLQISKVAMKFFEKYAKDDVSNLKQNKEFIKEVTEIKKVVEKRIKVEEDILFLLYKNYCE